MGCYGQPIFFYFLKIKFMRLNNFLNKVNDNSFIIKFSFKSEKQNGKGKIWGTSRYMRKDNVVLSNVFFGENKNTRKP